MPGKLEQNIRKTPPRICLKNFIFLNKIQRFYWLLQQLHSLHCFQEECSGRYSKPFFYFWIISSPHDAKFWNLESKVRRHIWPPPLVSRILFRNDLYFPVFLIHNSIKSLPRHIIAINIPLGLYKRLHNIIGSWTKAKTHLIVFSTSIKALNT